MGDFSIQIFSGIIFLMFIGLPVGIGFIMYFVAKRSGRPKLARYLTLLYSLCLIAFVFTQVFEDAFFTKDEAKKLVEEQQIMLPSGFTLDHNESGSSIQDYFHDFTLTISPKDKQNAIANIIAAKGFKTLGQPIEDLRTGTGNTYTGPKRIQNFETEYSYVREYLQPQGKGYAPVYRRLTINKNDNKLTFSEF